MHELPGLGAHGVYGLTAGERIRAARKAAGLTQNDLARRAGTYGPAISNYERDLVRPRKEAMRRIADAIGIPDGRLEDEERKGT